MEMRLKAERRDGRVVTSQGWAVFLSQGNLSHHLLTPSQSLWNTAPSLIPPFINLHSSLLQGLLGLPFPEKMCSHWQNKPPLPNDNLLPPGPSSGHPRHLFSLLRTVFTELSKRVQSSDPPSTFLVTHLGIWFARGILPSPSRFHSNCFLRGYFLAAGLSVLFSFLVLSGASGTRHDLFIFLLSFLVMHHLPFPLCINPGVLCHFLLFSPVLTAD